VKEDEYKMKFKDEELHRVVCYVEGRELETKDESPSKKEQVVDTQR
jgi:hypothetical protein